MLKREVKVRYHHGCTRCGYGWYSGVETPVVCPNCGSPYWNRERKKPHFDDKPSAEAHAAKLRRNFPQTKPVHVVPNNGGYDVISYYGQKREKVGNA